MHDKALQLPCQGLVDCLPGFIKSLQGKQGVAQVCMKGDTIRVEAQRLAQHLVCSLMLPLLVIDVSQTVVGDEVTRIAVNQLLKTSRRFIQLTVGIKVVIGADLQFFALAGVIAQLECLRDVLGGAPRLG